MSTSYDGPVFFLSLAVFVFFANTSFNGRFVDKLVKIAPYTFGVYLIHAHPFWHGRIWETVIPQEFKMPMVVYCLGSCVAIFLICVVIDMLRSWVFKILRVEKLCNKVSSLLPQL